MSDQGHQDWVNAVLENLAGAGEYGRPAVEFITSEKVHIGFRRQGKSTGAMVWPGRGIYLNPRFYSLKTAADDPYLLSLVAHEARHLQQGWLTTLSVYGELDAWKLGFRVYHALTNALPGPAIRELMGLPLNWDRAVLSRASRLMRDYAGKGYYSNLLPLYPLHMEIAYRVTHRLPGDPPSC
ncbi:MAG: hypothetical protein JXA13_06010 [Anaerolineales bacterium]|nr:hypothetical protein [Anaerolineales bacterium]